MGARGGVAGGLMIGVRGGGRDAKGVKEWRRGREWGRKGGGGPGWKKGGGGP